MIDSRNKYGLAGRLGNNMSILLDRIERQLGLSVIPLPDELKKDKWAAIIAEDTIPVFSQYFPHKIQVVVEPAQCISKDDWLFIDSCVPEGTRILGVKDVDFQSYRADARYAGTYGIFVPSTLDYMQNYTFDDFGLATVGADMISLFNLGIYIEFEYPNKIKLVSVNGQPINYKRPFPLILYVEHPSSLHTISPTMQEFFMRLAKSDIATAIYNVLKFYDGMDTTYSNLDLKLDVLQDWANRRDDIIRDMDAEHVSTANENQSMIMCV